LHTFLDFFIHFHFFYFFLILARLGTRGQTRDFAQVREIAIILKFKSAQFSSLIF